MTEEELKQLKRFVDRFLARTEQLERERDAWHDRFESLAYELEDLMERTHGVLSNLLERNSAAWKHVLGAGLLPTMAQYLEERAEQREKQEQQ